MRVFVTGWTGLLGSALVPMLKTKHDVQGMDIQDADICDRDYLRDRLNAFEAELVIHLAAMTAVDGCEANKDLAFRVNAEGSRVVAEETKHIGAKIVSISTDYVFDGEKGQPYDENDAVAPLNVYGESKLAGEREIEKVSDRWVVVRSAWLYGPGGGNFVDTILGLLETRDTVSVVNDQIGSPTSSADLARALTQLIETAAVGTYHLANRESASWHDLAQAAAGLAGLDPARVETTSTQQLNRPAPRPRYSVLDTGRASRDHGISLRSWSDALLDYINPEQAAGKNAGDTDPAAPKQEDS